MGSVFNRVVDIRDVTRRTYSKVMDGILSSNIENGKLELRKWFENMKNQNGNIHTKRLNFATLMVYLNHLNDEEKKMVNMDDELIEKISAEFKEINKGVREGYVQQKMTPSEKEKWEDWPMVEQIWIKSMSVTPEIKDANANHLYQTQIYSLIGLYTVIAPVRNDYRTVAIEGPMNHITVEKDVATIHLKEYKTSKKYGDIKIIIDSAIDAKHKLLFTALERLYKGRQKLKHTHLFADTKGKQLSSTNYSQLITGFYWKKL